MTPKVAVFGTLRFPPDQMEALKPHLQTLIETTYRDDGCIAYDVGEDPFDPGLLRFSELWPDQDSLSRHLNAPHIKPWRETARAHGLVERKFTAFEIEHAWEV